MSVNYVDKSTGDLIRVAGQGTAEYGASTVRKGTFTGTDNGTGLINITVTFDSPMPDADYLVDITDISSVENFWVSVAAKTKNGFALYLRKSTGGSSITVNGTYTAFKLYTDTEYNNLLNNAVLTTDVADSVTNGDMNPVTSNAVFDYLTPTEISVTLRSQLIDGGTLKAYRIGRMVFVNGSVHFTSVPTTNDWIFIGLPAPMSSTTITGVYALTNNVVQCTMATTGLVNGFEGSSGKTADWVAFNFSYVTAT